VDPDLHDVRYVNMVPDMDSDLYGYADLHLDANEYAPANVYEYLNIYTDLYNHAYPDRFRDFDR